MTTSEKPWEGIMPPEDVAAFGRGFDHQYRPMSAGTKPSLIIVDMTRAFVDSTYPSGFSPTGYPAVAANAALLEVARNVGLPIFFTKAHADEHHQPTPVERGRWKSLDTAREPLPDGTPPGDVIVDELQPIAGEIVIYKGSKPSGFSGTPLASYMIQESCDTAIVTGMTTSGCVRATLLDAFQNNFHCIVPFECSADRSQLSHKVNLFDMHMKYADVISLDETIDYIEKLAVA
jgi:nicotinamidase-related amidase